MIRPRALPLLMAAWVGRGCGASVSGRGTTSTGAARLASSSSTRPHHPHIQPHAAPSSTRSLQTLGYAAACAAGVATGVAVAAGRREEDAPAQPPPSKNPSSSKAKAWRGPASALEGDGGGVPAPAAPLAGDAEEAAAQAAIAASLAVWPLRTAKLACARRRPATPDAATTTTTTDTTTPPRPVVLVACGSFNPPTIAHLRMMEVAAAALRARGLDVWGAYLSPVGDGYARRKAGGLAPATHRLAMCEAAAAEVPGLAVDAWEAMQGTGGPGGPHTRSLHVLQRVAAGLERSVGGSEEEEVGQRQGSPEPRPPRPRVLLVCGSDLLASLAQPGVWKAAHVAALGGPDHGIVCVGRGSAAAAAGPPGNGGSGGGGEGGDDDGAFSTADEAARAALAPGGSLAAIAHAVTCVADPADLRGVSSSLVREGLASGGVSPPVRWLAPEAVLRYAARHGLYGPAGEGLGGVSGGGGRGAAAGTDA